MAETLGYRPAEHSNHIAAIRGWHNRVYGSLATKGWTESAVPTYINHVINAELA